MKIYINGKKIEITVLKKGKTVYEYYIGNEQIGETDRNISRDENIILRQNHIIKSLQKLGVLDKEELEKQNTLENEYGAQIKDTIDEMSIEDIKKEAEQTRKIDEYIEGAEIERNRIKSVHILELNEDRKGKEKDARMKENRNIQKNNLNESQNNLNQINEKTTTKDINIKQEVELDERANDMHNIRKWLGGQVPKDIEKIGVIESYQMNKMKNQKGNSYDNNTTRYSLVAISKDGTVEPLQKYIPKLQQRDASGNNPTSQKYQVQTDGTVEKDAVLSEYQIGDKIIQLDNEEMGRVEMNIGEEARNSTETLGVQVRDSNTIFVPNTSQRSVIGEYEEEGEDTVEKGVKEIKAHDKQHPNCSKTDERDIDGDLSTSSHEHIMDIENAYIKVCARKILDENPEISETYNQADIEKKLTKKFKESDKEYLSKEDLEKELAKIVEDIKEEAEMEHELPGNDTRRA